MIQTLTVVYLHIPSADDKRRLQEMEYGLTEAFHDFCRETFSESEPLDYPLLRLVAVSSPEELDEVLFGVSNDRHFLSNVAKNCCLFLIDDLVRTRNSRAGDEKPPDRAMLNGETLANWLRIYFPAIPKVVLTIPGHQKPVLPTRRWTLKDATVFFEPYLHRERLIHLFKSFWMPRFWTQLRHYVRTRAGTNWHTPGHNSGNAFEHSHFLHGFHDAFGPLIFRTDLSVSVESLGDLSTPEGHTPLSEAQRFASEVFGTAQSSFVTNGTSTSNKALLMTLLRPGETVLLDRNCHKSVHHAVVMAGAVPRYLPSNYNHRLGVWGPVSIGRLREELERTVPSRESPRMLILTTCTYEGILYPVWEIGQMCEKAGVLFYADEAWAPYLNFHPFYTSSTATGTQHRYNAVNEIAGAHFAVQSTHKALAAFSQASMIHVSTLFRKLLEEDGNSRFRWLRKRFALHGRGSWEKFSHDFHEVIRYWHSTSPHYPMLATLDIAGVQMRLEGLRIIEERLHWVAAFKKKVALLCGRREEECFAGLQTIAGKGSWEADGYLQDPLKMILCFKNADCCSRFTAALRNCHIQWEKSTPVTVLFLVTVGTVEEHFEYLYRVCRQLPETIGLPENRLECGVITRAVDVQPVVLPRDAALCDGELVALEESEGRICSQLLVPYPPGIPVFLPGLPITRAMIELVRTTVGQNGADAVHGLFVRGKKIYVEVLNRDEEHRVQWLMGEDDEKESI